MNSPNLLLNRIQFKLIATNSYNLYISKTESFEMVGKKAGWLKSKFLNNNRLIKWLEDNNIDDDDFLKFQFAKENSVENAFNIPLDNSNISIFDRDILLQELGEFLKKKGFYIAPNSINLDFSAYQKMENYNDDWDLFRRIDFKWKPNKNELIINIGSYRTFISKSYKISENNRVIDEEKFLIHKSVSKTPAKILSRENFLKNQPEKFNYQSHFNNLKKILTDHLYQFNSELFQMEKTGFKRVDKVDFVFRDNNFMKFGNDKTAKNAVVGMREYGPYRKLDDPADVKLLFLYHNRDDANMLYLKLKKGEKHFPGLLSYVGIPVVLAGEDKKLQYNNVDNLPNKLNEFLQEKYPSNDYIDTLAIVIGPFDKNEPSEKESEIYYKIKKLLLEKGIASQFVNEEKLKRPNFHYSLPNIAIAILGKLGGVPWKLNTKKTNELVIGFNIRKLEDKPYLGSAVFFNNEGELGKVTGFHDETKEQVIKYLRSAIKEYIDQMKEYPEKMVIHYYKPPRQEEIDQIFNLLYEEFRDIPFAILEINDTKSKVDICFDADYEMGMPQSGAYVKVGSNEYLLFNNNRFIKKPISIEDELPIKIKIPYADQEIFHNKELLSQVYEFSRLNWKCLKQRSQPITIYFSKLIADFSAHFSGKIPNTEIAQKRPWFL